MVKSVLLNKGKRTVILKRVPQGFTRVISYYDGVMVKDYEIDKDLEVKKGGLLAVGYELISEL